LHNKAFSRLCLAPNEIASTLTDWQADISAAADILANAEAVLVIAGAGFGVDSGLPDYRGPAGFWKAYPALANAGISMEHMSSTQWFLEDPCQAWG
jgi:NAD-dependent SIR2 family protein deacetylase